VHIGISRDLGGPEVNSVAEASCCTCHQGAAGAPGPSGKPGLDGKDGGNGKAGAPGADGIVSEPVGPKPEPCIICPPGPPGEFSEHFQLPCKQFIIIPPSEVFQNYHMIEKLVIGTSSSVSICS
jgi:hypothetical protein